MRDGPASGRMGFGYRQHQKAGIPFRAPASSSELNLRQFVARHPELKDRVAAARAQGRRPASIIDELRLEGCDGSFSVELWKDPEGEVFIEERFGPCPDTLRELVAWGMGLRLYGSAEMWRREADGEWRSIQSWPPVPE